MFDYYKKDFKLNIKLAVPIIAGQTGQIFVNLADNIMVGRLGAEPLAAVSLANAIFVVFVVVGMGISFALAPLISFADGANEDRKVSQYFKHSLMINVLFSVLSIFLIELSIPYFYLFKQDPKVLELALPYLRISMWTMIPMMLFLTLRGYVEGLGETIPPMKAIIIGNIANVILNYGFIYGKMGFPNLGVSGAALASLFARVLMLIVLLYIIFRSEKLWSYIINIKLFVYQKVIFRKVLKLGVPTSLQMFFEISAFSGAAIIMGMVSSVAQAAHQIAINMASITFLICTGLSMVATIRVGNQLGKGNHIKVRSAGISAIIQVTLFMTITALLFIAFKSVLPYIYIDDIEVVPLTSLLLVFAAIFQIPDGIQVVTLGALRGVQDVRVPTLITFVAYWFFGIPVSYYSALHWGWGPQGVWIGLIIGLTISSILLTIRFLRISKVHPKKEK